MVFPKELIDFFKRHNLYSREMFEYFSKNAIIIDYKNPDQRHLVGCFYTTGNNKKLKNIHLIIPYIYDDITLLVCIHEIIHAILFFKKLNKKVSVGIDCEVLPMFYEKLFVDEKNTPELIKFEDDLNKLIDFEKDIKYVLGLTLRDELKKTYNYDIDELNKKAKKLVRKYNKN